ncbi:MAG: hypothetical protein Q8Q35_00855 [Nanoarchaeota archaeon]|nr:hypothetical protein [Nanoarchaeota archaeon]
MPILTAYEIIQLVILSLALGYIFSGFFSFTRDPFKPKKVFDWDAIKFAAIISTPAVVFHEFGHKFIAMAFGLSATFFIWPTGLIIGIILKAIGSPFLFLAPAYVSIPSGATSLQMALIALAGPAVNLLLWGISSYLIKTKKNMSEKELIGWTISKKLNLFLFIFNMIPIPPLDGFSVIKGLFGLF